MESAPKSAPEPATETTKAPAPRPGHVALFATCLVELYRPGVALAALSLLEGAGFRVSVPAAQTCCGQPHYNAGARDGAALAARRFVETFAAFDAVVVPSGSCAAMARVHMPQLLEKTPLAETARAVGARTFELMEFLARHGGGDDAAAPAATKRAAVTYHDSCSGLRELGIKAQPRTLLARAGIGLHESENAETCCGFGGTFCVKQPKIAEHMADSKLDGCAKSGATTVLGGDLGCLLHMAGRSARRGDGLEFRHVAEVLAGDDETPSIGAADAAPEDGTR